MTNNNYYFMTLGKKIHGSPFDEGFLPKSNHDDVVEFESQCYYDSIRFHKIGKNIKKFTNSNGFLSLIKDDVGRELFNIKKDYCFYNEHIQQNILLMNAEDRDILKYLFDSKKAPFLFITFVKSSKPINTKDIHITSVSKEFLSIYYTLGHSDYVLIADGTQINLNDYLIFLNNLRSRLNEIQDITTIYGYNKSELDTVETKVDAVISTEIGVEPPKDIVDCIVTLGRYDQLYFLKNKKYSELFYNNQQKKKVHIGTIYNHNYFPSIQINRNSNLVSIQVNLKNYYKSFIEAIQKKHNNKYNPAINNSTDNILFSISEIYKMVYSMLEREISQYFAICIMGSFIGLLDYLDKCIINSTDEEFIKKIDGISIFLPSNNITHRRIEYATDLLDDYCKNMGKLSSSMLHNEQKYVQSDPFQLVYYDLPPKLIAFYTAMAYFMIDALDADGKNKYTLLFVPDFKTDINVSTLTHDRDIEQERNILVIHISECSVYDIWGTICSMAHEIAHHVGQSVNFRNKRYELYKKCCIASIIYKTLCETNKSEQFTSLFNEKSNGDSIVDFSSLIDNIYKTCNKNGIFVELDNDESRYYTDEFIESVMTPQNKESVAEKIVDALNICLKQVNINYESINDEEFKNYLSSNDKKFKETLAANIISEDFAQEFNKKSNDGLIFSCDTDSIGQKSYDLFSTTAYLFRETFADTQMFLLLSGHKNETHNIVFEKLKEYYKSQNEPNDLPDDIIRFQIVSKRLNLNDGDISLYSYETELDKCFYEYISKSCIEYIDDTINYSIQHPSEKKELIYACMNDLCRAENFFDLIKVIDGVIEKYVSKLASNIY